MKNVRMLLTGAIVIAIVGSSLAFTKVNPNLFACVGTDCIGAFASSISGTVSVTASNYYTTDAATTHLDCLKPGSTTQGCSRDNHPAQAFKNE